MKKIILLGLVLAVVSPINVHAKKHSKIKAESQKSESTKAESKASKPKLPLYDRLGGTEAIKAVVDEFVKNVGDDKRINKFFAKTDLVHLKAMLVDQICQASGGPCKYIGKDMKTAHKDMGVSGADFDALVEDLVKVLDKFKVGPKEKDDLIALLAPMKGEIVKK